MQNSCTDIIVDLITFSTTIEGIDLFCQKIAHVIEKEIYVDRHIPQKEFCDIFTRIKADIEKTLTSVATTLQTECLVEADASDDSYIAMSATTLMLNDIRMSVRLRDLAKKYRLTDFDRNHFVGEFTNYYISQSSIVRSMVCRLSERFSPET